MKELDNVDMLTLVIQEMSKKFPTLMETLVHERDQLYSSFIYIISFSCCVASKTMTLSLEVIFSS